MPTVPTDSAGPSHFGGKEDEIVLCAGKGIFIVTDMRSGYQTTSQLATYIYGTVKLELYFITWCKRTTAETLPALLGTPSRRHLCLPLEARMAWFGFGERLRRQSQLLDQLSLLIRRAHKVKTNRLCLLILGNPLIRVYLLIIA